jgi:hypothetical protein
VAVAACVRSQELFLSYSEEAPSIPRYQRCSKTSPAQTSDHELRCNTAPAFVSAYDTSQTIDAPRTSFPFSSFPLLNYCWCLPSIARAYFICSLRKFVAIRHECCAEATYDTRSPALKLFGFGIYPLAVPVDLRDRQKRIFPEVKRA